MAGGEYIRLRGSVGGGVAGQHLLVEQAAAEVLVGLVVGDDALLGLAVGGRAALALHGASGRRGRRGRGNWGRTQRNPNFWRTLGSFGEKDVRP